MKITCVPIFISMTKNQGNSVWYSIKIFNNQNINKYLLSKHTLCVMKWKVLRLPDLKQKDTF